MIDEQEYRELRPWIQLGIAALIFLRFGSNVGTCWTTAVEFMTRLEQEPGAIKRRH